MFGCFQGLRGHLFETLGRPNTKTTESLILMTLPCDLLHFRGLEDSEINKKYNKRRTLRGKKGRKDEKEHKRCTPKAPGDASGVPKGAVRGYGWHRPWTGIPSRGGGLRGSEAKQGRAKPPRI